MSRFPTSLKGETLTWYDRLLARSIDSFDTLVKRFSSQYATSRSHRMTSTATSKWRRCQGSEMRSDRSGTKEKEAPGLTHTSWTNDTSQTSASLSQGDPSMSVTHP
ncbi:hypothetical protein JHK82_050330 [Glycine max]|nr:hypothetical protein JHK82_050330 [Glycine max]KAG5094646.1 hypothetical protein JHK84_050234 [Glycine max]